MENIMKKEVTVKDYNALKDELQFILDNDKKEEISEEFTETINSVIALLNWIIISYGQDYINMLDHVYPTGVIEDYDYMLVTKAKASLYALANNREAIMESIGLFGCYNLAIECSHISSSRDETDQIGNRFLYSLTDVERMYQRLYTIFDYIQIDNTEAIEIVRVAYNYRAHSRYLKSLCAINKCESSELEEKINDHIINGLNKMVEPFILSPLEKYFMEETMNDDTLLSKMEELVESNIFYLKPNGFPLLVTYNEDGELQNGEDVGDWFHRINAGIVGEIEDMTSIRVMEDISIILDEYNLPTMDELDELVIEQFKDKKYRKEITPGKILVTYYASLFGKTLKEFSSKNFQKLRNKDARREFFNMEDGEILSIIEKLNGEIDIEVITYMTLVITILGGFITDDEALTKNII